MLSLQVGSTPFFAVAPVGRAQLALGDVLGVPSLERLAPRLVCLALALSRWRALGALLAKANELDHVALFGQHGVALGRV